MDLGLTGKTAIVCASSAGLGRACALELARAGATVVINGRNAEALERTAEEIRQQTGATILTVAGDVGDKATQDALLAAAPAPDILVNNNGGPPPKDFRQVDRAAMEAGLAANMITPVELIQRVIDGMIERKFGRILCITSGSVKAPIGGLDLSSGARIGLTGFLAGVARQVAGSNVTINFLLPGSFDTARIHAINDRNAKLSGKPVEQVRAAGEKQIPAGRYGDPAEFGAACAFLCSAQAGYITGQSLLIDGGRFPGVL